MRIILVVLSFFALLSAAALSSLPRPIDGAFRFTSAGSISTLDPANMSWVQDLRVGGLLYEGLFAADPITMQPQPACAERVELSADRTEYRFVLRPTARWSNGDPVTADDFIFAWRRAIEPGTAADYAFFLHEIEGVADYVAWRWSEIERIGAAPPDQRRTLRDAHLTEADERFARGVGLAAEGPGVLRVTLRRPVAYWLDVVSYAVAYPLHRAGVERFRVVGDSGLIFYNEQWARPGRTQFNGPFMLADWQFKRGLRLDKNRHYWDAARVRLDSAAYVDVADGNTAWLMYSTGRLDWLPTVETGFAPALAAAAGGGAAASRRDIHVLPVFGTYYYNFNCNDRLSDGEPNPFADPRVRRAFTRAVDRESLVTHVTRCGEPPATALVPVGVVPDYPAVTGLAFDAAAARNELAAAGYPGGRGFPRVRLIYSTESHHGRIAESIAGMWRDTLGVETRLVGKEVQSFREDKKNQHFMVARASWYGDYLDPTSFLDTMRSDNGNNDSAFRDPAFDALMDAAESARDPSERLARLAAAERYLVTQAAPLLPLYQFVQISAFHPDRVRGLCMNPRMIFSVKNLEVRR